MTAKPRTVMPAGRSTLPHAGLSRRNGAIVLCTRTRSPRRRSGPPTIPFTFCVSARVASTCSRRSGLRPSGATSDDSSRRRSGGLRGGSLPFLATCSPSLQSLPCSKCLRGSRSLTLRKSGIEDVLTKLGFEIELETSPRHITVIRR